MMVYSVKCLHSAAQWTERRLVEPWVCRCALQGWDRAVPPHGHRSNLRHEDTGKEAVVRYQQRNELATRDPTTQAHPPTHSSIWVELRPATCSQDGTRCRSVCTLSWRPAPQSLNPIRKSASDAKCPILRLLSPQSQRWRRGMPSHAWASTIHLG